MAQKDLTRTRTRRPVAGARCLLVLVALLMLGACAGDDDGGVYVRTMEGCSVPYDCDIGDRDCQLALLEATACARGNETPKLPPLRTITKEEFRDELEKESTDLPTTRTPWDEAATALGLQAAGVQMRDVAVDHTVESVVAYFDSADGRITVIEGDAAADPLEAMYVLSHELTHYLQDRAIDGGLRQLRDDLGSTLDNHVAGSALVEGDATVTSTRVFAWLNARRVEELDWDAFFEDVLGNTLADVADSSSPLIAAVRGLPYPIGGKPAHRAWAERGRAAVDDLFARPHDTLVDWVDAYVHDSDRLLDLRQGLDCQPPGAPQDLVLHDVDSFGAAGVLALLSRSVSGSPSVNMQMANTLRGDAIVLYASSAEDDAPASPFAVAWRLRFESADAAQQFEVKIRRLLPADTTLDVFGPEVLLTASDTELPAFDARTRNGCPSVVQERPSDSESGMSSTLSLSVSPVSR